MPISARARWLSFALSFFFVGCDTTGVGAPCTSSAADDAGPLVTPNAACRRNACVLDQDGGGSYCSCQCGGTGDPGTFCSCPAGFMCATATDPSGMAGYCVRAE